MVRLERFRSGPDSSRSPGSRKKKRQVAAAVAGFLGPLFKESGSDVPSTVDFTLEAFHKYKRDWLLYRSLGHKTDGGMWVSPLSYEYARGAPKEMLDVFQGLDYFLAQMEKKRAKKKEGALPNRTGSKRFK